MPMVESDPIFRDIRRHASQRMQDVLGQTVTLLEDREDSVRLLVALLGELFTTTAAAMVTIVPRHQRTAGYVRKAVLDILAARVGGQQFESQIYAVLEQIEKLENACTHHDPRT